MRIIAVIPCLNEAKHIAGVVSEAKKHVDIVLVSDGGSTDSTPRIASGVGAAVLLPGAAFITGYGAVIQRGIKYAKDKMGADIIVLLDGDGQHDPADIPSLLAPVLCGRADVAMGCRIIGDGMPRYRRFGNRVLSAICNVGAHFKPPDAVTGYWAVATKAMPALTEKKWGMAIELLVKTRGAGWSMAGVPVRAVYHENYTDNSSVSPLRLGLSLLWSICKWRSRVEVFKEGKEQ